VRALEHQVLFGGLRNIGELERLRHCGQLVIRVPSLERR